VWIDGFPGGSISERVGLRKGDRVLSIDGDLGARRTGPRSADTNQLVFNFTSNPRKTLFFIPFPAL
jgi:hypothetical protein